MRLTLNQQMRSCIGFTFAIGLMALAMPARSMAQGAPIPLPERMKQSHSITFCSDLNTPPSQFLDPVSLQPDGAAVDMLKAIGKTLGVETRITNITFSGIFPALDTNKCDAIMSSTSKSPERLQKYNFVDYWAVGSGIMVKRSQAYQPTTFEDLSGHSVSVLLGSRNQQRLAETNAALTKAGRPLIDIASFPAATIAFQELNLGRVDAMVSDTMVLAYFVKLSHDKFVVSGAPVQPTTFGMVIPKANDDVTEAIQAAVNRLAENGGLAAIADKWGVESGLTICRTPAVCP